MPEVINFVFEYWDWLKENGYTEKDCSNRSLLHKFYYEVFHPKYPEYTVNGFEYLMALGKLYEVKHDSNQQVPVRRLNRNII